MWQMTKCSIMWKATTRTGPPAVTELINKVIPDLILCGGMMTP